MMFFAIRLTLNARTVVVLPNKTKKPLLVEDKLKEVAVSVTVFSSSSSCLAGFLNLAPDTTLFEPPVAVESLGQSLVHS